MTATYKAFVDLDASLIEFNPLVVSTAGDLLALDAKIVLDDNALFRHQDLEALRDEDEVDPTELEAKRFELNYVKLAGNIGVMVNGAGLALSTIDLLKEPKAANPPISWTCGRKPPATRSLAASACCCGTRRSRRSSSISTAAVSCAATRSPKGIGGRLPADG